MFSAGRRLWKVRCATYTDVTKDVCKDEFLSFKRCLEKAMKKAH